MRVLNNSHHLNLEELLEHVDKVRNLACRQFIYHYNQHKYRRDDPFMWGDEIEGHIMTFNHESKTVRLHLCASKILKNLREKSKSLVGLWSDEVMESMLESCPKEPYGDVLECCDQVEKNMKERRKEALANLGENETYLTLTMFPRFGCRYFTEPSYDPTPDSGIFRSLFIPDESLCQDNIVYRTCVIISHKRREKRGMVNIPIFKDTHTPDPYIEDLQALGDDGESKEVAKPNHVYEDCGMFGLGSCALQVTLQASCLEESKFLHDQLCLLAPIMMALSAACPVRRGYLTELDCRWQTLCDNCDDRSRTEVFHPEELNYKLPNTPRWESNVLYLSKEGSVFNDLPLLIDERFYQELVSHGVDSQLALQLARSLLRIPIFACWEQLEETETETTNMLTVLQSSYIAAVLFKIPEPSAKAFWRLELKAMDVQITDFENAAYAIFVSLFAKVFTEKRLNWLIPMSKLQENFMVVQKRNAVLEEKFWIKKDVSCTTELEHSIEQTNCSLKRASVDEIINGSEGVFPGIIPIIREYVREKGTHDSIIAIDGYLKLIQQRASGNIMTGAQWIRKFIMSHHNYKHDSFVGEDINYDLLTTLDQVQKGDIQCPELLG